MHSMPHDKTKFWPCSLLPMEPGSPAWNLEILLYCNSNWTLDSWNRGTWNVLGYYNLGNSGNIGRNLWNLHRQSRSSFSTFWAFAFCETSAPRSYSAPALLCLWISDEAVWIIVLNQNWRHWWAWPRYPKEVSSNNRLNKYPSCIKLTEQIKTTV